MTLFKAAATWQLLQEMRPLMVPIGAAAVRSLRQFVRIACLLSARWSEVTAKGALAPARLAQSKLEPG
jgi:hypothetical protein